MTEKKTIHIDFSWFQRINWRKVKDGVVGGIATGLFTGFSPFAPGTAGSLLGAISWWFLMPFNFSRQVFWLALLFALGVYTAGQAESWWGRDDQKIVIDEVFGMWFSLLMVPHNIWWYLAAFVLFRICDIVKFFPIDRSQRLPGGWGVMADDLLAGMYTGVLMQLALVILWPQYNIYLVFRWMPHRFILYALLLPLCLAFVFRQLFRPALTLAIAVAGALWYYHWFPFFLIRQWLWIAAACGVIWWLGEIMLEAFKFDIYRWGADRLIGIWLLLWFIPRIAWVYVIAIALYVIFSLLDPWPSRLARGLQRPWNLLLDDVIVACYASAVLQTVVMIFWQDEMVLVKYVVLKLMGGL